MSTAITTQAVEKLTTRFRVNVGGLTLEQIIEKLDNVPVGGTGLFFRINHHVKDMVAKPEFTVTDKVTEVNFTIATPADLGFTENPTSDELFNEVNLAKHGLELCRPYDGPSLRLVYTDQPVNEWLVIAMKPIRISVYSLLVFYLERNDSKLCFHGIGGVNPRDRLPLDLGFVFRLRNNQD